MAHLDAGQREFIEIINALQKLCYENSAAHGFWEEGMRRNKGEMIALMHSELSEALEAVRKPRMDDHCPSFSNEVIELADVFIRLMDYAGGFELPLGAAIVAKMQFNVSRPPKRGKAF